MPTTRPRYQVTDTGEVREILDAAQAQWPEIHDRKQLLIELVRRGAAVLRAETEAGHVVVERRRAAQRQALAAARGRVDVDVLLRDDAWR